MASVLPVTAMHDVGGGPVVCEEIQKVPIVFSFAFCGGSKSNGAEKYCYVSIFLSGLVFTYFSPLLLGE